MKTRNLSAIRRFQATSKEGKRLSTRGTISEMMEYNYKRDGVYHENSRTKAPPPSKD